MLVTSHVSKYESKIFKIKTFGSKWLENKMGYVEICHVIAPFLLIGHVTADHRVIKENLAHTSGLVITYAYVL